MPRSELGLRITLLSDVCFGRGDGVAGLVDTEVEHDDRTGLPRISGRTIKGLLTEECAAILFALREAGSPALDRLSEAAGHLFGGPGSWLEDEGALRIGPGLLPVSLREAVAHEVERGSLDPAAVLSALTDIRRQSAIDDVSGAPVKGALRATRVVLRQTDFESELWLEAHPEHAGEDAERETLGEDALALLAACARAVRRGGTGRNRGRGRLRVLLIDAAGADLTTEYLDQFSALIMEPAV